MTAAREHDLRDVEGMEGLTQCAICGGAEGALPTDCPGRRLTYDEMEEIHHGKRDFVGGQWAIKAEGGAS